MPRRTFLYSCLLAINCNLRFLHCHHTCIVFYYTTSDSHTINKCHMFTHYPPMVKEKPFIRAKLFLSQVTRFYRPKNQGNKH